MLVRLNLAINPLQRNRRFKVYLAAAGAVASVLFLMLGWHDYHVREAASAFRIQTDKTSREIDQLNAERHELDEFFSRPENAKLHDRAAFVNAIIDARSFNWTRMFMDLEKLLPDGVRVLKIEPRQLNGQAAVKMTIGAASEESKRKFLSALEQSDSFSHVQLNSVHSANQEVGAELVLELTFIYSRA